MYRIIILTMFLISAMFTIGPAENRFSKIADYQKQSNKHGGWKFSHQKLDLDKDGDQDYIVRHTHYDTDPYISILLKSGESYLSFPFFKAHKYKIITQSNSHHIRVDIPTYGAWGNLIGVGKYYWHDFYVIIDNKPVNINSQYRDFYKVMIARYHAGIKEEVDRENEKRKDLKSKGLDDDLIDSITIEYKGKIKKYKEFIKRAELLISQ